LTNIVNGTGGTLEESVPDAFRWMEEARAAFDRFDRPEWTTWGPPWFLKRMHSENADRELMAEVEAAQEALEEEEARRLAEDDETAKREREEKAASLRSAKDNGVRALLNELGKQLMTYEEVERRSQELQRKLDEELRALEGGDGVAGETEPVGGSGKGKEVVGSERELRKRKRVEDAVPVEASGLKVSPIVTSDSVMTDIRRLFSVTAALSGRMRFASRLRAHNGVSDA
jgi:hypothetical protein